jgi:hypothetical protein
MIGRLLINFPNRGNFRLSEEIYGYAEKASSYWLSCRSGKTGIGEEKFQRRLQTDALPIPKRDCSSPCLGYERSGSPLEPGIVTIWYRQSRTGGYIESYVEGCPLIMQRHEETCPTDEYCPQTQQGVMLVACA